MGQAVDQAERERELTKQRLAGNLERLESRVRAELDWRARLRRDGARYAVIGAGAVATLAALLVLRAKLHGHDDEIESPAVRAGSLADIAAELAALRDEVERSRKGRDRQPLWQKVAMKAVVAAGTAAGAAVARSFMERAGHPDGAEPDAEY